MILIDYIEVVFWASFAVLVYIYFGYPVVLWILSRFFSVEVKKDESFMPSVTLMILAHNEEKSIRQRLENALDMDYPMDKLEIIVVSNGSTDKTDEMVRGYASKGIKLFSYKKAGKTNAQNLAVPEASGEIIVFSDANTNYKKDALKKMTRHFFDTRVGLVCGRLSYIVTDSNMVGKGEGLYWGYDGLLKILESKLGSCLVANGSIIAFRRKLYEPIDENLTEDFVLPVRILSMGYINLFEPQALAFEKTAEKGEEEFARKKRIVTQGSRSFFTMLFEVPFKRLFVTFEMISHKMLRWSAGVFLGLIFIANLQLLESNFYLLIFALQLFFYSFACLGFILEKFSVKVRVLHIPYYFCLVNIAAIIGILNMLFGGKMPTWQKAESTR